jgi:hypothetical protein
MRKCIGRGVAMRYCIGENSIDEIEHWRESAFMRVLLRVHWTLVRVHWWECIDEVVHWRGN